MEHFGQWSGGGNNVGLQLFFVTLKVKTSAMYISVFWGVLVGEENVYFLRNSHRLLHLSFVLDSTL